MPTAKTTKVLRLSDAKSEADRKRVAQQILRMRKAGVAWDGDDGIVAQGIVSGAPQGRTLLRKFNLAETGNGIAKSYDRSSYGLKGPRTAPAKGRKTGKAAPKAKAATKRPARKAATAKPATKRTPARKATK